MLTSTHEKAQHNGWAFSAPPSRANAKPENSTPNGGRLWRAHPAQQPAITAGAGELIQASGKGAV
ncbi:hypothetical protein AAGW18_02020 [Vreelandella titanicae]|uniref:hypothetical protein n=1 Tax=Vreelandella titanicae TaxID=664683 RepID=UPI00315918F7